MGLLKSLNIKTSAGIDALVNDLETSYAVQVSEEEIDEWWSVGNVYDTLYEKIEAFGKNNVKCASVMALNILQREFKVLKPKLTFAKEMDLNKIDFITQRKIKSLLKNKYNIEMPQFEITKWSFGLIYSGLIICAYLWKLYDLSWWLFVLPIFVYCRIYQIMPAKLTGALEDVAFEMADMNYAYFVSKGAEIDDKRLVRSLVGICGEYTLFGLCGNRTDDYTGKIGQFTLLYPKSDYDPEGLEVFESMKQEHNQDKKKRKEK